MFGCWFPLCFSSVSPFCPLLFPLVSLLCSSWFVIVSFLSSFVSSLVTLLVAHCVRPVFVLFLLSSIRLVFLPSVSVCLPCFPSFFPLSVLSAFFFSFLPFLSNSCTEVVGVGCCTRWTWKDLWRAQEKREVMNCGESKCLCDIGMGV